MKKINLKLQFNIQFIFILILAGALILSLVLRPSTPIDTYEDELRELEEINRQLGISNDSIIFINNQLQQEVKEILNQIDGTKIILQKTEEKLVKLEAIKYEIPNIINNMDGDSITHHLSEYLNRRN